MMNKWLLTAASLAVFLVVAGVGLTAGKTAESATAFPFLIRGEVAEVNNVTKRVTVKVDHGSVSALNELRGMENSFAVNDAVFYKWIDGVKTPVSSGHVKAGQEVVIRGQKDSGGTWKATWLVINDKGFELVGRVKDIDPSNKKMTVLVGRSSYQQAKYVNKEIKLRWTEQNTKCKRRGTAIACDAVPNNNQLIKVFGDQAKGSHAWVINRLFDSLPE